MFASQAECTLASSSRALATLGYESMWRMDLLVEFVVPPLGDMAFSQESASLWKILMTAEPPRANNA